MDTLHDGAPPMTPTTALREFFAAPIRLRTYRNLLYLAVQFPLGVTYFVALTLVGGTAFGGVTVLSEAIPDVLAGASAGGIAVVPLALAALVLVVVAAGLIAVGVVGAAVGGVGLFTVDRLLTGALLGRTLPTAPVEGSLREDPAGFVRTLVTSPRTYLAVAVTLAKFPLGVALFVATLVPTTLVIVFLLAPFVYNSPTSSYQFSFPEGIQFSYVDGYYTVDSGLALGAGTWTVDTFPESLVVAGLGVVTLFVALNAFNLLAYLLGRATALVARHAHVFAVPSEDTPSPPRPRSPGASQRDE
jgi:hypothetical protein